MFVAPAIKVGFKNTPKTAIVKIEEANVQIFDNKNQGVFTLTYGTVLNSSQFIVFAL